MHYATVLIYKYQAGSKVGHGLGRHQPWLPSLIQYDSQHYISIAKRGYKSVTDAAFLPLFPLTIRYIAKLIGSYSAAGLISAWVALSASTVVFYKLIEFEYSQHKVALSPWLGIGLIAIFPTAFYFAIPYTESLFLLLSLCAIYSFRKERYLLSGVFALLACLTKYQGVILIVFFAIDYLITKKDYKKLLPALGAIIGFGSYMVYLKAHYGSATTFITAEKAWGRLNSSVITNFLASFRPEYVWFIPVLIVGLIAIYRYLDRAYFYYTLVFLLLPLASGRLDGLDRYMVTAFPLFIALPMAYLNANRYLKLAYLGGSFFIAGWFIMLYANGYIVA